MPSWLCYLQRQCLNLLADPERRGLVISAPVQHGKSEFISHIFPAHHLINNPDQRVMILGHDDEFATKFSTAIRNTFKAWAGPLRGLRIRSDLDKSYDWQIKDHRGGCFAGNVYNPSGRGADLLIGDDIIRSMADANSPTIRNKVWEAWMADAYGTRLQPNGKCILVMSRRHLDDPIGRTINSMVDGSPRWKVVRLPALAEANDVLGRVIGQPLWPGRFGKSELEGIRDECYRTGTGYLWETLRQQNPMGDPTTREWPDDYFTDFYYDEIPPSLPHRFRWLAVDPSKGSTSRAGDFAAFLDATGTQGPALWIKPFMKQMSSAQVEEQTLSMMAAQNYDAVIIDGNVGQDIIGRNIYLKAQARGIKCPVYNYKTIEHKLTRIRVNVGPVLALRRVRFLNPKVCNSSHIVREQFMGFPTGQHDDAPDALEMLLQHVEWMYGGKARLIQNGTSMELAV